MSRNIRLFIALSLLAPVSALLVRSGAAVAQQSPPTRPFFVFLTLPIDMDVRPASLQFVRADDGARHLAYNLFVTNWSNWPLRLVRLDVEDATTGQVLVSYDKDALENPYRQRTTPFSIPPTSPQNRNLDPSRTTIFLIDIRLEGNTPAPRAIRHRIVFEPDSGVRVTRDDGSLSTELMSLSEPSPIKGPAPVVLGPPLRGGPWICANGLGLKSAHNSIDVSHTARMRVPQRYGCDFLKVASESVLQILPNPFPNVLTRTMFYGYGEDVLAVANARVADVRDGIPESVPQADGSVKMPVPLTEDTIAGNRIVLDLGGGRYAFYAHLQPGSIRVRRGDRVREGQVLGMVGMAGNAVNPHLHFQVGNAPDLNGSEGMPYVFKSYILVRPAEGKIQHVPIADAVPLEDSIMIFPGSSGQNRQ